MKTVFNNYPTLIQAWLSGHYDSGRTSATMSWYTHEMVTRLFFEGEHLYSYGKHYELARMVKGGDVILITSDNYSKTTQKHKRILDRELHGRGRRIYTVSEIGWDHRTVEGYKIRIQHSLSNAIKCRASWKLRIHLSIARSLVHEADRYIKEFDMEPDNRIQWLLKYQDNMLIDKGIIII